MTAAAPLLEGLVVASHGRHVLVEKSDGERVICHPRGKKSQALVGDHVLWQPSQDEGTIEKVLPRRNRFDRQDEVRTKSFAANLDQVLILLAADPEFSESQLARALIAAEAEHIPPLIVFNKRDLSVPFAAGWARLAPYRHMGYAMVPCSLRDANDPDLRTLQAALQGKTTLVLGPSGSGKSTLINLLVPNASAVTGTISRALNSGKHTTTSTTLYWMDAQRTSALLDSPGFQEFGLHHIDPAHLSSYMPDLKQHVVNCRFYNCTHLHEPGCGVLAAVGAADPQNEVSESRHRIYQTLFAELSQTRY